MTSSAPRAVQFSETMAGWFAMGATDPLLGAREGRRAGTGCSLKALVQIADIASFARTADHVATLHGRVDMRTFDGGLSGVGRVRLFAPGATGKGKVLEYHLPLVQDGKSFLLAGSKTVNGGAPWRVWNETTTLYTRLHDGPDANAPVIGAGVLRIRMLGLLHTLTTFRGAGIPGYGRFFAGELLDSYVL